MNSNSKEFKELRKSWYDKLVKEGFKDAEREDQCLKRYETFNIQSRYTPDEFLDKRDYYIKASNFFHDYVFEDETLRFIWKEHMEGTAVRAISILLKKDGIDMPKSTIHDKIRRLAKIMYGMYAHE